MSIRLMSAASKPLPQLQFLEECFRVGCDGRLWWLDRPRHHFKTDGAWRSNLRRLAGSEAGTLTSQGYIRVSVTPFGNLRAHRIVWAMENQTLPKPGMEVDHIDGVRNNNHPSNLRLVSHQENQQNLRGRSR